MDNPPSAVLNLTLRHYRARLVFGTQLDILYLRPRFNQESCLAAAEVVGAPVCVRRGPENADPILDGRVVGLAHCGEHVEKRCGGFGAHGGEEWGVELLAGFEAGYISSSVRRQGRER